MAGAPSDAGAIVLLREDRTPEVYWVERAPGNVFLAGYRAFVGGRVEPADAGVPVRGAIGGGAGDPAALRPLAVAAVRELFEEVGVLLASSEVPLGPAVLAAARADLGGGRPFGRVLADLGATVDLDLLRPAGRWVTPAFAPRRFDTHFFLARLPAGQEPGILADSELASGEWTRPADALAAWERSEVLVPPPVLHILRSLALGLDGGLEDRLIRAPGAAGAAIERIEFLPGIVLVPLKTDTLPPATHTNAYVVGRERAVIVDPASPDPGEQARLERVIGELQSEGVRPAEILLTHHHPDHVGGVAALRARLGVPVAAHALTRDALAGRIAVDRVLGDGDRIDLGGGYSLHAMHTQGHTKGHLCFFESHTRALLTGDNVVGFGTVLIDPPEGDMDAYLDSLRRLQEVDARALFGGHGPAVAHAGPAIRALITHRLWREGEVVRALAAGERTVAGVAARSYQQTPEAARRLTERQALAHLERLERAGRVRRTAGEYVLAG